MRCELSLSSLPSPSCLPPRQVDRQPWGVGCDEGERNSAPPPLWCAVRYSSLLRMQNWLLCATTLPFGSGTGCCVRCAWVVFRDQGQPAGVCCSGLVDLGCVPAARGCHAHWQGRYAVTSHRSHVTRHGSHWKEGQARSLSSGYHPKSRTVKPGQWLVRSEGAAAGPDATSRKPQKETCSTPWITKGTIEILARFESMKFPGRLNRLTDLGCRDGDRALPCNGARGEWEAERGPRAP